MSNHVWNHIGVSILPSYQSYNDKLMVTVSWNEDLGHKLCDAIRPNVEKHMEEVVSTDEPWTLNRLVDFAQSQCASS